MWFSDEFSNARQDEARRRLAEGQATWWDRGRLLLSWPTLIAAIFWLGASGLLLAGKDRLPHYLTQRLTQPIFSRVTFERVNVARTAEKRKAAQQDVPNYFRLNQTMVEAIQSELRDVHAGVKASEHFEAYATGPGKTHPLSKEAFAALKELADEKGSRRFKQGVDAVARRLALDHMIERADIARDVRSTAGTVRLDSGDGRFVAVPKENLTYAVNSEHVDRLAASAVQGLFAPALEPVFAAIIKKAINPATQQFRPVYVFDSELTKRRVSEAGLLPEERDRFEVGDPLIKPGIVDGESLALLKAEQDEYLRQRGTVPELRHAWQKERIGLLGIVALITLGLTVYTRKCQPSIAAKPLRALALALLLLFMLLTDQLVLAVVGASPIWSVATITMTAAILTVAYSQIFALGATVALALLTSLNIDSPFRTLVVLLSVAAVTVILLKEIRTRLKMVEVGGLTALTAAISASLVSLTRHQDISYIAKEAAFAALAALAGASIVLVLLPLIEKIFRITTSLTLLEWADTSQPLLRQLIEKAPGTWQHSHMLGSMAEAAAEQIGANGLLVRVGAYYHDIGKICKPHYFIENQQPSKVSAHRNLAPTMSLLVILAHVKDGLAMAREHRLPPVLHRFIAEHHGTTVVRYFHAMAEAKAGGREVNEQEFRHPGPKPHSRESAILMLCDGVEGAVRSLGDPTPSRIESVVHKIVMDRLMDGQFDDCDITLKELARVEQSLVKSLQAIHHGRIAYPTSDEEAPTTLRSA